MTERPRVSASPLITHRKELCAECWSCVRCCPVHAIRVAAGRSEVVPEKCIACGQCVTECARSGFSVRDDTQRVRELLRTSTTVVALLASEFIAALYPMTVPQIERALETLGFDSVETTLLGEELVAAAYERLHSREGSVLSLRSTCPVAVDFVRKYHPAFVPALAPVVPPFIAQARLIRSLYPQDVTIVYVSPCYARKDEIHDPEFDGVIDVAIDFSELKSLFAEDHPLRPGGTVTEPPPGRPSVLKEISLTDGFPRQTLVSRDYTDASVHVVRGIGDIDRLLTAIAAGEAGPTVIDMLNCEGCIDGPTVAPGLSLFAKRNVEAAVRRAPGTTRVSTRAMLGMLPVVDVVRSFVPEPVAMPRVDVAVVDAVLAEGGFDRSTVLDCGACGWPTCAEHAVAIHNADSTWEMCLPLQQRLLQERASVLADAQTLDDLTGVWNRRAFGDRLAIELARVARYGSPMCLALIDIDDFGAVNDAYGRDTGDLVLAGVADRVRGMLRITDVLGRWISDRFAVILPGVSKTEAFAAAEKLRQAIGSQPIRVEGAGYTHDVRVTVSIGVAAGPRTAEVLDCVDAADGALIEAMSAGGNQVRLAPG